MIKIFEHSITISITIILTMLGFWLSEARYFVTSEDVNSLIRLQNQTILLKLEQTDLHNQKLTNTQYEFIKTIHEVQTQLAIITERLEHLQNAQNAQNASNTKK